MIRTTRVLALVVVSAALAAGCSKPVSPHARSADGALRAAAVGSGSAAIPSPYIVRLKFVGPVVTLSPSYQPVLDRNAEFFVYATGGTPPEWPAPIDTVPVYSQLKQVLWRVANSGAASTASAGEAGVFEAAPVFADAQSGDLPKTFEPGTHLIWLQAPERAGGGRVPVVFQVDFAPGAWWAGPDPALFPPSSDGDGRAVDVSNWTQFATSPAWPPDGRGYFGPDSLRTVPSQRRPVRGDLDRRTFYEIFGDRIYARSEGDTVHVDSWVVLVNAGFDRDSRYLPIVNPADPALPPGYASNPDLYSVLIPHGMLGSPSAFRSVVTFRLPDGTLVRPSETSSYPNFDPFSVFRSPHVVGYWRTSWPGKAYAVVKAMDGEGVGSPQILDAIGIADRVDAGGGTPDERLARRRILTFHVRAAAATPADSQADESAGGSSPGARARR